MNASAWNNGGGIDGVYGIRVVEAHRDIFFHRSWTEVAVEMDGLFHLFPLTNTFWSTCPEIRDSGGLIRAWLVRHYGSLTWPKNHPWQVVLTPVSGNGFRLSPEEPPLAGGADAGER